MKYTDDQSEAIAKMLAWSITPIKSSDDLLYTLDGAAGTGKTTIAKAFITGLGVGKSKIAVTAPTHKAKKVIQDATGFNSQTIQKLLGLRPDVNMDGFNPNKPVFNPIADDEIQFYKYVMIDESSMLNKDAFELIKEKAIEYHVRIIFMGDAYQLPPVNEKISKVFSAVKHISTLTTVVRQDPNNPMFEILKMLRTDVKYGTENGIKKLVEVGEHITEDEEQGFKCLSQKLNDNETGATFGSEMLKYFFSTEYKHNKNHIKFLAYTNDSIEAWCKALREKLLKEDAKNLLNVGEFMTAYTSISNRRTNTIILENSEDYVITDVQPGISKDAIAGFHITMVNSKERETNVFVIDHTIPDNVTIFKNLLLEKLKMAKQYRGSYWASYYGFKHYHLSLVNLPIDPSESYKKYGNMLCGKDLYYGYGCTVHKSQGSTYDNVAINLANIYSNQDISERARLVYVALSRTRNMNLILIK